MTWALIAGAMAIVGAVAGFAAAHIRLSRKLGMIREERDEALRELAEAIKIIENSRRARPSAAQLRRVVDRMSRIKTKTA